jgi:DNA gyrase inhibitor GyrI
MSACILLNKRTSVNKEVSLQTMKARRCIVARFKIKASQFQEAWEGSFA